MADHASNKDFPEHWKNATVLIVAHGSENSAAASFFVERHVAALNQEGMFAEVLGCYLRGNTPPAKVLAGITTPDIYVVPFMVSNGYSIDALIPSALNLTGKLTETVEGGKRRRIHLCDSVGTHPEVGEHVQQAVAAIVSQNSLAPSETAMIVAAHGTEKDSTNAEQARTLARYLARDCNVKTSLAVFLEEPPLIADWQKHVSTPSIIVVPYLMTLGSHSTRDIPRAFRGLSDSPDFMCKMKGGETIGPHQCGGRTIWYLPVVGCGTHVTHIIRDRVLDWDKAVSGSAVL